jgi:hypothetical protein
MIDETQTPQINISKIPMGSGIGGRVRRRGLHIDHSARPSGVVVLPSRLHRVRLHSRAGSPFHPA